MSKLLSKSEVCANVAIVIAAVVVSFVMLKSYIGSKAAPLESSSTTASAVSKKLIGQKMSVLNVDWAGNRNTLVMALQTGCHFCRESGPFYKDIAQRRAEKTNIRIIAVLPQPVEDGKQYLGGLGVQVDEVRQLSLASVGVAGTPTLLLVDNQGVVTDAWVGKLNESSQAQVLSKLHLD